jgi:uncharacterized protein YbbC (DUF1343 family)
MHYQRLFKVIVIFCGLFSSTNIAVADSFFDTLFGIKLGYPLNKDTKLIKQLNDFQAGGVVFLISPPIPNSGFQRYEATISHHTKTVAHIEAKKTFSTFDQCLTDADKYRGLFQSKYPTMVYRSGAVGEHIFEYNDFVFSTQCTLIGNRMSIGAAKKSAWAILSKEGKPLDASGF